RAQSHTAVLNQRKTEVQEDLKPKVAPSRSAPSKQEQEEEDEEFDKDTEQVDQGVASGDDGRNPPSEDPEDSGAVARVSSDAAAERHFLAGTVPLHEQSRQDASSTEHAGAAAGLETQIGVAAEGEVQPGDPGRENEQASHQPEGEDDAELQDTDAVPEEPPEPPQPVVKDLKYRLAALRQYVEDGKEDLKKEASQRDEKRSVLRDFFVKRGADFLEVATEEQLLELEAEMMRRQSEDEKARRKAEHEAGAEARVAERVKSLKNYVGAEKESLKKQAEERDRKRGQLASFVSATAGESTASAGKANRPGEVINVALADAEAKFQEEERARLDAEKDELARRKRESIDMDKLHMTRREKGKLQLHRLIEDIQEECEQQRYDPVKAAEFEDREKVSSARSAAAKTKTRKPSPDAAVSARKMHRSVLEQQQNLNRDRAAGARNGGASGLHPKSSATTSGEAAQRKPLFALSPKKKASSRPAALSFCERTDRGAGQAGDDYEYGSVYASGVHLGQDTGTANVAAGPDEAAHRRVAAQGMPLIQPKKVQPRGHDQQVATDLPYGAPKPKVVAGTRAEPNLVHQDNTGKVIEHKPKPLRIQPKTATKGNTVISVDTDDRATSRAALPAISHGSRSSRVADEQAQRDELGGVRIVVVDNEAARESRRLARELSNWNAKMEDANVFADVEFADDDEENPVKLEAERLVKNGLIKDIKQLVDAHTEMRLESAREAYEEEQQLLLATRGRRGPPAADQIPAETVDEVNFLDVEDEILGEPELTEDELQALKEKILSIEETLTDKPVGPVGSPSRRNVFQDREVEHVRDGNKNKKDTDRTAKSDSAAAVRPALPLSPAVERLFGEDRDPTVGIASARSYGSPRGRNRDRALLPPLNTSTTSRSQRDPQQDTTSSIDILQTTIAVPAEITKKKLYHLQMESQSVGDMLDHYERDLQQRLSARRERERTNNADSSSSETETEKANATIDMDTAQCPHLPFYLQKIQQLHRTKFVPARRQLRAFTSLVSDLQPESYPADSEKVVSGLVREIAEIQAELRKIVDLKRAEEHLTDERIAFVAAMGGTAEEQAVAAKAVAEEFFAKQRAVLEERRQEPAQEVPVQSAASTARSRHADELKQSKTVPVTVTARSAGPAPTVRSNTARSLPGPELLYHQEHLFSGSQQQMQQTTHITQERNSARVPPRFPHSRAGTPVEQTRSARDSNYGSLLSNKTEKYVAPPLV
ncbi:unnamed protein product, partial [Amoebophrya sp. A120]